MSPWCCRRSSTTAGKPPGPGRCDAVACASASSGSPPPGCPACSRQTRTSSSTASPKRRCSRWCTATRSRASSRARQCAIWTRCPFRDGIGCSSRGVASRCRSPGGRSGDRCRCWRAAAAPSSAPTVRTASRRRIARAPSATSSTSSRISPTRWGACTWCSAILCSRRAGIGCSRSATASRAARSRTPSSARRGSIGSTSPC